MIVFISASQNTAQLLGVALCLEKLQKQMTGACVRSPPKDSRVFGQNLAPGVPGCHCISTPALLVPGHPGSRWLVAPAGITAAGCGPGASHALPWSLVVGAS